MQPNSITQAIDETVHQVQVEQDELYHCLYAYGKLSPSSQGTNSAHLCTSVIQGQGQTWAPIFDDCFPQHHFHKEEKKSLPRATARRSESEPGLWFLQLELTTATILPANQSQARPPSLFPSSQFPTPLPPLPGCRFPSLWLTRPVSCL